MVVLVSEKYIFKNLLKRTEVIKMRITKRILASLVTLSLVLTSVLSFSVFAENDEMFSDVDKNNVYYDAITELVDDGVINGYEDGTFKPEATITRAEFAKLLAVASAPTGTKFTAQTTKYTDMLDASSPSAWAIPYVNYASGTKVVDGYPDGTFKPTKTVTYGEAVKMIVCTLNYGSVVEQLDPWYKGYVNIASQIGLSKYANGEGSEEASRGIVAQLIYNMKSCKPLVNGEVSDETFDESKDNSVSSEGILYGVFEHSLTGRNLTKNEVLIGNNVYRLGKLNYNNLKNMVGQKVSFKFTNDSKPELTKVTPISEDNVFTTIEDWQIADVSESGIEYYASEKDEYQEKTTEIKFGGNLFVILNGKVVDKDVIDEEFIEDYLFVENGQVKFLSNDSNPKTAEVAYIESYETYFVSSVATSNDITTFYDKYPSITGLTSLALDSYDVTDVKKITSKDGNLNSSSLTGISKNTVVSVAMPYDSMEGTKVIISSITVNGSVTEKSSNYNTIKIDGKKYDVSPYFKALLDNNVDVTFEINDQGKFYLDHMGRITFFEKTESTNPYALLVQYRATTEFDTRYALNISNSSSNLTQYELKEEVRVNGTNMDAEDVIDFLIDNAYYYDDAKPNYIIQPIKYSLSGGKISALECINLDDIEEGNIIPYEIKNTENSTADIFANGGKLTFTSSGYAFKSGDSTQFRMNSSTVVYVVPGDITKASEYSKKTYTWFKNGESYCVEPYDVEDDIAKVVVCYLDEGETTKLQVETTTSSYLINEVREAKNPQNGENTRKIYCYKAGQTELFDPEGTYVDAEKALINKVDTLKAGDVVKFVIENGEIVDLKTIFVYDEDDEEYKLTTETGSTVVAGRHIQKSSDNKSDYYQAIYGTVKQLDTTENTVSLVSALTTDTGFDVSKYKAYTTNSPVFYKLNTKGEIEVIADGEIVRYDNYDDDALAKENASHVLALVYNQKVIAVYLVD